MEVDFSRFKPVSRAEAAAGGVSPGFGPMPDAAPAAPASAATAPASPRRTKRRRPASARARQARKPVAATAEAADTGLHFIGGPPRALAIPLTYPVAYAGRPIAEIILRRMDAQDVALFFEGLRADAEAGHARTRLPPIFYGRDGVPIPAAVLDFLDPDDDEVLNAAVPAFLPECVKRALGLA